MVIEFPTCDAALECYRSPEYAKAMELRRGKSVMDLAIVRGYDGPQPAGRLRAGWESGGKIALA